MVKNKPFLKLRKTKVFILLLLTLATVGASSSKVLANWNSQPGSSVNIWWPSQHVTVSGQQEFKADLPGWNVNEYQMYWSVDNDKWNKMDTSYAYYPHKQAEVDTTNWTWRGYETYKITFIAVRHSGQKISENSSYIYITGVTNPRVVPAEELVPVTSQSTPISNASPAVDKPSVSPTQTAVATNTSGSLRGSALYVSPNSNPGNQARIWRENGRTADAALMDRLAAQPGARWFGDWNSNIEADVRSYVEAANAVKAMPVLVAYNIPNRDCGSYSAGGSVSGQAYVDWISAFSRGIGTQNATVILEPDAISGLDCLSGTDRSSRNKLISDAISTLKQQPRSLVYIDAGNARWHSVTEMANRFRSVDISGVDGFSLNVSNYISTAENVAYGTQLSVQLNGKPFVIDTSRNGIDPGQSVEWCNPSGRSVGQSPTTQTNNPLADAYLWLKAPGESDGTCNGGPTAGAWWPEYALGLTHAAGW